MTTNTIPSLLQPTYELMRHITKSVDAAQNEQVVVRARLVGGILFDPTIRFQNTQGLDQMVIEDEESRIIVDPTFLGSIEFIERTRAAKARDKNRIAEIINQLNFAEFEVLAQE